MSRALRVLIVVALAAALGVGGYFYWRHVQAGSLPAGIAGANGRLEADQVDVSTKMAGRVVEILAREGDFVARGAVIARMDRAELDAQVAGAAAQVVQAEKAAAAAAANVAQAESQQALARQEFERAESLQRRGFQSIEVLDQRRAQLAAAEAAVAAARATEAQATAAIDTAKAGLDRLKTLAADTELVAPRAGRVQYRLAEPGEVLAAGARVVTLLDVGEVYMTIYLPAAQAGRLAVGGEARLVLDPVPDLVIPAAVSFVSAEAQFTPNAVETRDERDKLMFKVKLRIDPALLDAHREQVKTGVRGMGYVRYDAGVPWPAQLDVRLSK
ncbi:HlyD family secretion protein [Zavarzinia compransoris]|uniref:Efflux transporter periplasmic adaptor subunit n=1 Tax=Zavarzinia compransoris TaxID=1264899 RepID=A0A317DYN9_9PROT|nr:HlyD family efflux transporter periplasmic adaptor subunit [Zavarzinia compransoris]PWR17975.1 efflux transporter periplasmic adaptor subunit [Zavarzinia compransoris]TDP40368.1 HlyD family secretion protein [Zavarzinia compransoris]